ncbi:MAG: flagellar filament capping protein FliD [Opitutaceae bacterium]
MPSNLQLSGLASGLDWKSLVDQLMSIAHAPADRLAAEKTGNTQKITLLADFGTKLAALQTSATSLGAVGAFGQRVAASTTVGSGWSASASTSASVGNYQIAVSQLASAAHRDGASDIGTRLSATSDVSGLTLANLPIASAITAGTFTVNNQRITIALTDTLASVLSAIETASIGSGNPITAAYDPTSDTLSLTGTGEVVLGAANDSSNFLSALKLGNNGTSSIASASKLGSVKTSAALALANLAAPITAVDGSGNGTFSINGVSFAYNVNTDTLSSLITRINQSTAGVTATYDPANDRVKLTNKTTGDVGISVNEAAGGLLGAFGLTTAGTLVHGENAEFTVNGGAMLTSKSNTLDETAHGITGLAVTVSTEDTQTIQVSSDAKGMRAKIEDFIAKFNAVQSFLDASTKITTDAQGKVTAAALSNNREIQSWGSSLRSMAFAAVPGLSGTIARLENLGIDFKRGTSELQVTDGTKLDAALRDNSSDVSAFFQTASTGFAAKFGSFLTTVTAQTTTQQTNLNRNNTSLNKQIADIERRLVQQRAIMESAFISMETAQSALQSQQSALTRAFPTSS